MWAIENSTPYAVGKSWTRDQAGEHVWLVAVKATFDVTPQGQVTLSDEQVEPLLAPEYHGDPSESSLRHDAEIVPAKPTTDVLFVGNAHAPRGQAVRSLGVSLRVGPVRKELVVHGPRVYRRGIADVLPSPSEPFETLELTYEWAYGGTDRSEADPRRLVIDRRNPVGKGVSRSERSRIDCPAHRIEYPSGSVSARGPAGFGPIARHWSPRAELAGTYDARWSETRMPLLPVDYDVTHELCAPADQRPPSHLVGGEPVELVSLAPWGPWRFDLPRREVSFITAFGRRRVEHLGKLSTVTFDPARQRVLMVWQTALTVVGPDCDYLDYTSVRVRSP